MDMIHKTKSSDQAAELHMGRHTFGQGMKIYFIPGVAFVIIFMDKLNSFVIG